MDMYEVLKRYFGYDGFRNGQEDLIGAILSGRDVLGDYAYGGGEVDLLSGSGVAFAGDYGCDFSVDLLDEGSGAGAE